MAYNITDIDNQELEALGLIDEQGNILLSDDDKQRLESGLTTDDISLKNILIRDQAKDFDCKLSLYNEGEKTKVKIHPYYRDIEKCNILSTEEINYISKKEGVHIKNTGVSGELLDYGKAPYQFDDKQQDSFYVKLQSEGKERYIWGVMLEEALKKANVIKGTEITVRNTGIEPVQVKVPIYEDGYLKGHKDEIVNRNNFEITPYDKHKDIKNSSVLIEYDENSKSFAIVDSNKIPLIQAVNGRKLTKEQQEDLKEGKEITLDDDIKLQASPKSGQLFSSNKKLLICSMLLDGGLSFMMIKAAELIQKKIEQSELNKQAQIEQKDKLNGQFMERLTKIDKEIDSIVAKHGNNPDLQQLKTFVTSEYEKAEASLSYKNPQVIVSTDDRMEEEEKEINQDNELSKEELEEMHQEIQAEREDEARQREVEERFEQDQDFQREVEEMENDISVEQTRSTGRRR